MTKVNWAANPTVEEMTRELCERAHLMGDTEFSVKSNRLRQAGGYWPKMPGDWMTAEGRALSKRIKEAKGS